MKNPLRKLFSISIFIFCLGNQFLFGQQAKINPLAVTASDVIEEVKNAKSAHPNMKPDDLVKLANSLLDKKGFNYVFEFDENTCRTISEARAKSKDPKAPLNLNAKLNSITGEKASLVLPDEHYDKSECGRCFVLLPVWEATEKDFVTFVQNVNVKFFLPANFQINEIDLVDNQNLNTILKRWKIPFRAQPFSISDDAKILYLSLPDKELSDLTLAIYDEGMIQFDSKAESNPEKKGTLLKDFPKDAANPNLTFISFGEGDGKQTLKFTAPCPN